MNVVEEILTITQEECAEIIQVISKGSRFGYDNPFNGTTARQNLTQEVGDLLAMIELMVSHNIIDKGGVSAAMTAKFEKLKQWSNIGV